MDVTLKAAEKTEAGIFENLLELYLHDFSEFSDVEIGEGGRFGYPYLDNYWDDPDRFPYLILANEQLAGFALVRRETDPRNGVETTDLAEFFVLRQFRRQQVGSQAAITIWNLFPGLWRVRVLVSNRSAYPFWQDLIATYSANQFKESEESGFLGDMKQFTFEARLD